MLESEMTLQDNEERQELTRKANMEIFKLAEAAEDICKDDDRYIYHGIMARIKTLTEVIYYAQRLYGEPEGDEPDMQSLKRSYDGML